MRLMNADELIAYVKECEEKGTMTWEERELIIDFIMNTPTFTEDDWRAYWGIYG